MKQKRRDVKIRWAQSIASAFGDGVWLFNIQKNRRELERDDYIEEDRAQKKRAEETGSMMGNKESDQS